MPSKKPAAQSSTVAVSAKSIQEAAGQGRLAPDEERVLRMRHGAGVGRNEVLGRVGQDHPGARAQLASLELEAFRAMGNKIYGLGQAQVQAQPSRAKEKIVRALRKKG